MSDEAGPYWNPDDEKLRCLLVLDDSLAPQLSHRAGTAYFRAFIVENRITGDMKMKFRFRYKDPDERNWFRVKTELRGSQAVEHLRSGMEMVMQQAANFMRFQLPKDAIEAFYPPDDGGDVGSSLIWLEMNDLMEITGVLKIEDE